MASIFVSDPSTLQQALSVAKAGDTILLSAGVYSGVEIENRNFASDVTITSADPGAPAVLTGLIVDDSSGLTFSNLEMALDIAKGTTGFAVYSSRDIHFDRLNIHGSMDGNPTNDGGAMLIRRSSDVSVTNSEIHQFSNGIAHLESNNITISGNRIHDLQMDGVRGGGSSFVTITNNHFSNFFPKALDHPDAIQFWTANTTTSAHDIVISGNVMERGAGGAFQGVFLGGGDDIPYLNVKIDGNVIIGSMWHGVMVAGADGVVVTNNIVAGYGDMKARITLDNVTNATLTNNQATDIIKAGTVEINLEGGNKIIAVVTDGGASILSKWLAASGGDLVVLPPIFPVETTYPTEPPVVQGGWYSDTSDYNAQELQHLLVNLNRFESLFF